MSEQPRHNGDGASRPPVPRASGVSPTLVLGVGNILLRDEGIGVRAVEAMQKMELPRNVEVFDGATAGLDLLDILAGRERVIIIDAADADQLPGTVMRLQLGDLAARELASASLHDFGVLETLSVARRMGIAPRDVIVLGVVPKDIHCGLALSPEVEQSIPAVIQYVFAELNGRKPD